MKKTLSILLALCMCVSFIPITVLGASVTVTTDKTAYTINEEMKITVKGVTEAMYDVNAFVSVTKQKARPEDYGHYEFAEELYETDGVWTFNAPDEVGDYEVRFYDMDDDYKNSLIVRVPIKIAYITDQVINIKTDKEAYTPKEEIKISLSGYTEAMETSAAFVSITKKNARADDYGHYEFVKELYKTDGVWTTNVPDEVGDYEIRFYAADKDYENTLVKTLPLRVTYSTATTSVLPDRSSVYPGDSVKIMVSGVTEAQKQAGAFVSITNKNSRPEDYGSYKYVIDLDQTLGVWTTEAPYETGEYEIRLYAKDYNYTEEAIIARAPLFVSTDAAQQTGNQPVSGSVSPGQNGVSDWAVLEINNAITDGLVTDKVTVDFQRAITREEFCELVIKLYESMTGKTAGAAPAGTFSDTNNEQVLKAYNLGIVAGVGEGMFAPGNQVSRQEIATMLLRAIRVALPAIDTSVSNPPQFIDGHEIDAWALEGVNYFASKEIIKGADGAFLPKANCTCEAAIALVKRVFDVFSAI